MMCNLIELHFCLSYNVHLHSKLKPQRNQAKSSISSSFSLVNFIWLRYNICSAYVCLVGGLSAISREQAE